ncbi:DUF3800 domain-containing protein, partial [Desulfolutivibrio sp.]|uniref:DUF3800 domain-containing protein n=1 Tax=Desulfolutivibrio sp. TaxID=2773296 RepID=UPI002F968415
MLIYFDESGDLGWTFDKPYRKGGSSRFLTIAHVFVSESNEKYINRFVRELYSSKSRPFKSELKAANLEGYDRTNIAKQAAKFISSGKIQIHAVTVTKENVNLHIREDENMIYNYMVKQCILTEIAKYPSVVILPDKRNTKMRLADSLDLYLKLQLFEELESETRVEFKPQESHNNYRVQ